MNASGITHLILTELVTEIFVQTGPNAR